MDMIGTVNTPERTVLIEGGEVSRALIDSLVSAASTYTSLVLQTSLSPFNSDHVPFIEARIPAVLTIEGTDSANQHIHSDCDTLDHVDRELATEIVRMNVAATAAALDGGASANAVATGS
jgi:Zn-dependent M28 family amino/carboxypeptidase